MKHLHEVTGLTPDQIRYELPYAQGLQLYSLQLFAKGFRFLGLELPESETFAAIAGHN